MTLNLEELLRAATAQGASSLLLAPGRPPVPRAEGKLQQPFDMPDLSFYDTEAVAKLLLSPLDSNKLNEVGSVEIEFEIAEFRGALTVFYGLGCHNLVFHLA